MGDPRANPGAALEMIDSLHVSRARAEEALRWSSDGEHHERHLAALDAATSAVGGWTLIGGRSRAARCWNRLHAVRRWAGAALCELRDWEARPGIPALPPGPGGLYPDDAQALAVGMGYPRALMPLPRRQAT